MTATYILTADGLSQDASGLGSHAWAVFRRAPGLSNLAGINFATEEGGTTGFEMLMSGLLHGLAFLATQPPGVVLAQLRPGAAPEGVFRTIATWRANGWRTASGQTIGCIDLVTDIASLMTRMSQDGFRFVDATDSVFAEAATPDLACAIAKTVLQDACAGQPARHCHAFGFLPGAGLSTLKADILNNQDCHSHQ